MKMAVESCCEAHDKAYGRPGTGLTRPEADIILYNCLYDSGRPKFAALVWIGVRLLGWMFWQRK